MTFQKITFVTESSRITYKIVEKSTNKSELSRYFIQEKSPTLYGFLEDFPNEEIEWKVPVKAEPHHFEKLFDLIQNPIDVDINTFYGKKYTDCPYFWNKAYNRLLSTIQNDFDRRGYNPCIEICQYRTRDTILTKYIYNYCEFEFGKNVADSFNLDVTNDPSFFQNLLTDFGIDINSRESKLFFDMYQYSLVDNRGDDDVIVSYFLKKYQKCLNVEKYINYDIIEEFDDWNNPIIYLIADFCGFDTYVDIFRIVRNYRRWNNKQLEISKKNRRFYIQNVGLPYFFESFGWKKTDAYSMSYDFYEKNDIDVKQKNNDDFIDFHSLYSLLTNKNSFLSQPVVFIDGVLPSPKPLKSVKRYRPKNDIKKHLIKSDGLRTFLEKSSDIAKYTLKVLDKNDKRIIASYTEMKRDQLRYFTNFKYNKLNLKISYKPTVIEPIKEKYTKNVFSRKQKSYSYFRKRM